MVKFFEFRTPVISGNKVCAKINESDEKNFIKNYEDNLPEGSQYILKVYVF